MNPTDIEALGAQYGAEYFERYGRGPYSYRAAAPYRHGEPVWERYFGQIADLIASELAPVTVLDAGCAIGFLVEALRSRGIEAWGIDISEFAIEHVPDSVREFCSVASVTDDLERDYDLIVCIEVLEHLPAELAAAAVENLCSHADQVIFSASPQGFRDPTHLNVRPTDYWVELFGRYGFFRNVDVDASLVAPHAIHLVRADRTAVSIAAEYERWHWRTLSEVRDLRAAREAGADAVIRAERAEKETAELRRRLAEREEALRAAEKDERDAARDAKALQSRLKDRQREVAELRRRLDERDAAVRQAGLERVAIERQLADLAGRDVLARQLEDEIAALHRTRLFRYAAGPRRLYGRLRTRGAQAPAPAPPELLPAAEASAPERPHVPPVHYCIDVPAEGHAVESDLLLPVRGWAVGERSVVSRVVVVVNGVDCGPARLGLFRPDVANALAKASALVSGFETLVDLRDVPDWEEGVRIELEVETLAGGRHTIAEDDVIELALPDDEEAELELLDEDTTFEPPDMKRFAESSAQAAIRLLVFTHDLGLGGGQLYLFELLRLLADHDDFAATVVAPKGGPLRKELEELGIPVAIEGAYPVGAIAEYEGRQAQLVSWAREGGFNAVLANTFGSFPGVDVAGRLGVPALWAIHESFDLDGFWRAAYGSPDAVHPLVKERAANALASAAGVIFEADATRDLYAPHGDANRFVKIPYGIDIEEIDRFAASTSPKDARAELGLAPEATVLLCLGTIEPRKAQLPLAQAFEAVADEYPDVLLVFVGARRDPFTIALEEYVDWARLARRVRIERVTDEIYPWYRAADALLCASDVESLPRTVLEAMAFGVPVIATRVFGLPELIDDGVTGYLCEPRDTADLAQTIDRFLSAGSEERAAIGSAGAAVVRERHDSRGYAGAYDRLLRSLIEDPGRTPAQILSASGAG